MHLNQISAAIALVLLSAACTAGREPPPLPTRQIEESRPLAEAEVVPGEVYELHQLTTVPQPINMREVATALERAYPPVLRQARVQDTNIATLVIDSQGAVAAAEITTPARYPEFDQATLGVVRQLRFTPGRIGSIAVRTRVEIPIQWTVQRGPVEPPPPPPLTPRLP
jgi:TonB family protein